MQTHWQRYSIIEAVVHLVNRDFRALTALYKRMGFIPLDEDAEPIVIALENALPDVLNGRVHSTRVKWSRKIEQALGTYFVTLFCFWRLFFLSAGRRNERQKCHRETRGHYV